MAGPKTFPPTTPSGHYTQRAYVTKNRIGMKRAVARFLKKQVRHVAEQASKCAGLSKAADDAARRAKDAVDHVQIDWAPLADDVESYLAAVAAAGGRLAADQLDATLPDAFGDNMRQAAQDWAADRAAEMVGMRREGDFLVPNPNAQWRIDDTTRDMIQAYVTSAIEDGDSTDELAERLSNSFAFSDERAEMIARTEIAKADSEGAIIGWKTSTLVKAKSWLTAEDDLVSEECAANEDAGVVELDWDYGDGVTAPPQHPNCLPGHTRVLASSVTATSERRYDGDLVVIHTASGKQLACTPNHPILTPGGWVAAGLLHEGGHVIGARVGQWEAALNFDYEDVPASIEDVAEAFRRSDQMAAMPVPTAPEHFHGDGEGSEVAVIRANRLLLDGANPASGEHVRKLQFGLGGVKLLRHDCSGPLDLLFHRMASALSSFVGGGDLNVSSFGAHAGPFESFGLAGVAPPNSVLGKDTGDHVPAHTELSADAIFRCATNIGGNDGQFVDCGLGAGDDVAGGKRTTDGTHADAMLSGDFSKGQTALIIADQIVDVRRQKFAGHVYNLQTVEGFYIAEGIVTHNCRCVLLPEMIEGFDDQDDE